MANIIEVPFAGGEILFAAPGTSEAQAFGAGDVMERAADSLDQAIATMRRIGESFASQLAELNCQTAEASFGLTLSARGKFIVAEASAQASLTVKLVFKGRG